MLFRSVIADMQEDRGQALAQELGESTRFCKVEVRQESEVKGAIDLAVSEWGQLDCIFNNAGFGGVLGPIEKTPVDEFDMTMEVLVRGVFLGIKHAAPIMKAQGGGSIINTASIAGLAAGRGPHVYSAAKAAVIQLTRFLAHQLGPAGITANAIAPITTLTPRVAALRTKEDVERIASQVPLRRLATPEDSAQAMLFFASDAAAYLNGVALDVNGGRVMM